MRSELAHAKINLSLRVLAQESSGYHQIETMFCGLELADQVEVTAGHGIELHIHAPPEAPETAIDIPTGPDNHAWRAARLFADRTGVEGAHISLTKRIPHGAGLGGGSSDAAAVLRALNALYDDILSVDELLAIGAQIGSDVPFFITGAALALGWGRGGRLLPLRPMPSVPVLLLMPAERVSTADAYAALAATRGAGFAAPPGLVPSESETWDVIARNAINDFETVIFPRMPQLPVLLNALEHSGAMLARMTGTGSAVFGVFADHDTAEAARVRMESEWPDVRVWLTRTLGHVTSELE